MNFVMYLSTLLVICVVPLSYSAPTDSSPEKDPIPNSERTEVTLQQAINIVEKRRLTECVARTICELSCNSDAYGSKGRTVYQTLKRFESDTHPKLVYYKMARDRGQSLNNTQCKDCFSDYPKCKTPTQTLLRLANALTIKQ